MTANPDLVIRGGTIADGLGGELFEADVAITAGRISEVGKVAGKGKQEINAEDKLVTPGFVDVHTHYDGQVTWSQDINALVAERRHLGDHGQLRRRLRALPPVGSSAADPVDGRRRGYPRTGVERRHSLGLGELSGLHEWLSKRHFDMDIGAQLPHAALRVDVMGERGARRDPSTTEDNEAMAALAGEAVRAGALGFSTSRTLNHRTSTGDFTPTLKAGEDERQRSPARCMASAATSCNSCSISRPCMKICR